MEQTPKKAPGKNTLGQFEQGVRDEKYMVPELTLSHIRVRLFFFVCVFHVQTMPKPTAMKMIFLLERHSICGFHV
jgi:hypothetical protein